MHRLSARGVKSIISSVSNLLSHDSSPYLIRKHCFGTLQTIVPKSKEAGPADLLKWGSLGFFRNSSFATGFNPLQVKPLDSIMDIERVKDRSAEDITSIWDDYHLGRGHIGASMKAKLYFLLEQRAANCLLPSLLAAHTSSFPCGEEVVTQQCLLKVWSSNTGFNHTCCTEISANKKLKAPHMIFTGLEDYKARGTQASPYFTLSYYTEFAETKDLVLIRGDVVFTSKLTDSEAKSLMETTQSFYVNDARYKLVERFNKQTREFEFKDVLRALDMPIL